jgi:hypothetical protein
LRGISAAEPVLDHGADDHPHFLDVRPRQHQVEAAHGDQDGEEQVLEAIGPEGRDDEADPVAFAHASPSLAHRSATAVQAAI